MRGVFDLREQERKEREYERTVGKDQRGSIKAD